MIFAQLRKYLNSQRLPNRGSWIINEGESVRTANKVKLSLNNHHTKLFLISHRLSSRPMTFNMLKRGIPGVGCCQMTVYLERGGVVRGVR